MIERIFAWTTGIFILVLFMLISAQNAIISEGFGVVTLRQIDDYAIFSSLYDLYGHIESRKWSSIFNFIPYAYGSGFWYLTGILLYPFYKLNDPQVFIIAGRQLSTVFGFAGLFFLYKIGLKLSKNVMVACTAVIISSLSTPFLYWSQKCHVNTQYMVFGLVSYYFLIREDQISRRSIIVSGLFCGLMIGFKVIGLLLAPILGLTLLARLHMGKRRNIISTLIQYLLISGGVGIVFMAPVLVFFPFFFDQVKELYEVILLFSHLGTPAGELPGPWLLFKQGILQSYLSGAVLFVLTFLFGIFAFREYKMANMVPLSFLVGLIPPLIVVTFIIRKDSNYTSAYYIGVGILLPLLVWSLKSLKLNEKVFAALCIVIISFDVSARKAPISKWMFYNYRFSNAPLTIKTRNVFQELRKIEFQLPAGRPVRILRDWTSVFPINRFNAKVYEAVNYWNLGNKKFGSWDYIVLSLDNWEPDNIEGINEILRRETKIRNELIENHVFAGLDYETVFSKNGTIVLKKKNF